MHFKLFRLPRQRIMTVGGNALVGGFFEWFPKLGLTGIRECNRVISEDTYVRAVMAGA